MLSICLLAFNERLSLEKLVPEMILAGRELCGNEFEVLVVDDASTDHSLQILSEIGRIEPQLRVVSHTTNQGYAGATLTALKKSRGELIVIIDGDGQHPPDQVGNIVAKLLSGYSVVFPIRKRRAEPLNRKLASKLLTFQCWIYLGYRRRDINGGIKGFSRTAADKIEIRHFLNLVNPEIWIRSRQHDLNIGYVTVDQIARFDGTKSRVISKPVPLFLSINRYLKALRSELHANEVTG